MAPPPPAESVSQAQRSAQTRERLLEATLESLAEGGYAASTTTAIVERAGVSRGAMLHHYPSRHDLMVAAVEYVGSRRLEAFRAAVREAPSGPPAVMAALDQLWASFTSPTFYAMLELMVAARTDADLNERLRAAARRFETAIETAARELFGAYAASDEMVDLGRKWIYFLMQGMAVSRILPEQEADTELMVGLLKQLVWAQIEVVDKDADS